LLIDNSLGASVDYLLRGTTDISGHGTKESIVIPPELSEAAEKLKEADEASHETKPAKKAKGESKSKAKSEGKTKAKSDEKPKAKKKKE